MGLLNKNTGVIKKRVDFQNPETQKALKNLVEFLKNNFGLPEGESYQAIAEDAIAEAIQQPFIVSSGHLHEDIYSRALNVCQSFAGDEEFEDEDEQVISEPELEDVNHAIDSLNLSGSEKQIKWAFDIAHKSAADIAAAWKKKDFSLPTSAKWWIDNRDNIDAGLAKL
ncbi:hypothetical protein [Nostoc sp. GT001]|uniref:hypothetical protein n=1 Tax=Nostoc sp. GT001 TaxID=3056647 RepID=UPI0025AA52D5|nr:hypothetical protein [Nostoc sp. GT001]MDM9583094.1 hypothetical protein [Nostoc sp. GT001]